MSRSKCRPVAPPALSALLSTAVLLIATACGGGSRGDAPTIVLVTIDTLRADRVGCYGRAGADTAVMDRLAAGGVRFDAAQSTAPITLPAHASILTGRSLPGHGVLTNSGFSLAESVPVVTESFRKAGYATGGFVSTKLLSTKAGFGRGFDLFDDKITLAPTRRSGVTGFPERAGSETAAAALAWLATVPKTKPVFLWVHLFEPHTPYAPPPEIAARHAGDPYQGEVAAADEVLGRLVSGIDRAGRGRVLTLVAGDHGEGLGDHGETTHGIFLFQEVMRVPLIAHGPDWGIRPATVDTPVSLADLAPTVLELTALPALPGADGLSLAALVTGRGAAPQRGGVFAESHMPQIEYGWSGLRALVQGKTKLIQAPRSALYDLAEDPHEKRDLAAARAAEVPALVEALTDLRRRAIASAPSASDSNASVSEEQMKDLQALGYAASGRPGRPAGVDLVDPNAVNPLDRQEYVGLFAKAMDLVQQGRPRDALPLFEELRHQDPRNVSLLHQYGQALMLSGFVDNALEIFRIAVDADPGYALGWQRIGQLLDAKRDLAGAEAAYRKALAAGPDMMQAHKALAGLLVETGRLDEAIALLEDAQKLDPLDAGIQRDLERFRKQKGG
jgi:arylsulfatase A-like enzyme